MLNLRSNLTMFVFSIVNVYDSMDSNETVYIYLN